MGVRQVCLTLSLMIRLISLGEHSEIIHGQSIMLILLILQVAQFIRIHLEAIRVQEYIIPVRVPLICQVAQFIQIQLQLMVGVYIMPAYVL